MLLSLFQLMSLTRLVTRLASHAITRAHLNSQALLICRNHHTPFSHQNPVATYYPLESEARLAFFITIAPTTTLSLLL